VLAGARERLIYLINKGEIMMKKWLIGFWLSAGLALWASPKPMVFVSIEAQEYWVKKIAGEGARVESLIKTGMNAHTYEPKPSTMKKLGEASLLLGIGIDYEEAWFPKFRQLYPSLKIVALDAGMEKIEMQEHEHHDHGHKHDHKHGKLDPHVWLSVKNAQIASKVILESLVEVDGANAAEYQSNYDRFAKELETLDQELSLELKDLKGAHFMVFHPTWGYFARDYGLAQVAIEVEGKEPKPAQLKNLIKEAKEEGVKTIFVQKGFSQKAAAQLAKEIGAVILETDPLSAKWSEGMRSFAKAITQGEGTPKP